MEKILKILLVIAGILMAALGLRFMFTPTAMEADFGIIANRLDGLGNLRADLGGMFLGFSFFTIMAARRGKESWIVVPTIFMALILFGRILHIAIDGMSDFALRSTIVEIVLLAIFLWAGKVLKPQMNKE